ncbi:MAG: hypothetical protein M0Z28_05775 [Rhodospirillales bacterium]|nr:hypothetical protein [Rhodospirillales bacterium]
MSKTCFLVRRTCTRLTEEPGTRESRPLEHYRESPAYVLLGDPGAGKTESFRRESIETGGVYVKARDFATFDPTPALTGKTLFIDALDEMRAGAGDGRTPLDHIRRHLERLGRPHFRLSCREADWLGASDREALLGVAPGGELVVLSLDPLSDDDIAQILMSHGYTAADAEGFVRKAGEHGMNELLRNPQALDLLVLAVGGRSWPQSREATYEMACGQLVREGNREHRQARGKWPHSSEALLDAAGWLCAVHLLSGIAGYALDEDAADAQHFCLASLVVPDDLPLLPALKTNLFRRDDREQQRVPVHRSVAEYLGACHLAALINQRGLPLGRVLALLAGEDGGIVADLRGLAAWLSVLCHGARTELIDRDPLGVVLYGDVRNFPAEDKRRLFAALQGEAERYPWFRYQDWSSAPFGALATPDMLPTLKEILSSPSRSDADLALLDCALDALRHAPLFPELDEALEALVRDASYKPEIRVAALRVQLHDMPRNARRCLKLAQDIVSGATEDRDDRLLGMLLTELYPSHIPPTEVLGYLQSTKQRGNSVDYFWGYRFQEATPDQALPLLLDQLAQKLISLGRTVDDFSINRMSGELLARGLETHGDTTEDKRLYDWLGIGLDEYAHSRIDRKHATRIQQWFAKRPERYKALLLEGAFRCIAREDLAYCLFSSAARLYDAPAPADIGPWYLEQAVKEEAHTKLSGYYFVQAVHQLIREGGQQSLTLPALKFLEDWTAAHPAFQAYMEGFVSTPVGDWQQKHAIMDRERKESRQQRKDEWIRFFRDHLADIRDGSAHPKILHDLAQAYLRGYYDIEGETSRERLADFLGGDADLVQAACDGFRRSLKRDDLPSVAEIVELETKGRMHYLRQACLVGMEEFYAADPIGALQLDDSILSKLLAFQFTYVANKNPAWFDALVQERPALVADVLIAYAVPLLRKGKEYVTGIHPLAHDDAWGDVARAALPRLLAGFPLRARKKQLANSLDPLLKGALRYLERDALAAILSARLGQGSMDDAQRVYWLACGLMLAPEAYQAELARHVGASKVRRGYLGAFLYLREKRHFTTASLPESALALLIELLAPGSPPERPMGPYWVSPAMQTADEVRSFIDMLGGNPSEAATQALERLLGLRPLAEWHNRLRGALHAQRIARRKASFRHLDAVQVCRTLANLQPASAADLAALVLDHLCDIARKIRDGATDDYRQYWSYDASNQQLGRPKPENDCRDTLLSDLNDRLGRLGIDAQRESSYADSKRADITVSFGGAGGFNVPIEIKRDSHNDLWRAMHEQLIEKYVRDPATDGYGIYLVFWFGGERMPPPPDGNKPRSAEEIARRLRQTLTQQERHRILVCVFDCALR